MRRSRARVPAYLQQLVDLCAVACDLVVALLGSIISIGQIQQRRVLVLGPLKQRRLAPHRHHLHYLLHVVLGALQPTFQVVNHVPSLLDVVPDACYTSKQAFIEVVAKMAIRYDSGYLTCSKKLTGSQLSLVYHTEQTKN